MDEKNIDPDGDCPICGEPAEKGGVSDFRERGGKKFRSWIHQRSPGGLIIEEWCPEEVDE